MEDKSKLFVFERKEVFLLFLFLIVMVATAFTLGVRVGKSLGYEDVRSYPESAQIDSVKGADEIDFKSTQEEDVDNIVSSSSDDQFEDSLEDSPSINSELEKNSKQDIVDATSALEDKFQEIAENEKPSVKEVQQRSINETDSALDDLSNTNKMSQRNLSGKFTIQMVSKNSQDQALEYAEPFDAAGYDVIINKVEIPTKGTWYRVSIGAFDTKSAAENYIKQESEIFRDQKYLIQQFK